MILSSSGLETREILLGSRLLSGFPEVFRRHYAGQPAILVADPNTFAAAGRAVLEALAGSGHTCAQPYVLADPRLYAEHGYVVELEAALARAPGIPVAVGSGTINDLTKLAAHRLERPYVSVATAASMDGYTAFGASITHEGSKQTFSCPAPQVVVADLDVLCAAPAGMGAAGYADLLAKVTAGADWLLADGLAEEPIDAAAWDTVQGPLRSALADPEGVRHCRPDAVRALTEGLLASGIAMQRTRSSRPASGAEHQFSHLWDMQGHRHEGRAPAHGFKVGIATRAVAHLYEELLRLPLQRLDVDGCCAAWPEWSAVERDIASGFAPPDLARKALEETRAKWISRDALRTHLERVPSAWPELRERLRAQLLPAAEIARRLRAAGAPVEPEEIGISPTRLRESFRQAYHLRRRYTVLDLAVRADVLEACLERMFDARP
jgi:glycerol-1-phosphate dehydrogenase [NAD(P)+]